MQLMKNTLLLFLAVLTLSSILGCKPVGPPAASSGSSVSGWDLNTEVTPEAMIKALKETGFASVDGKTFGEILESNNMTAGDYTGVVALQDTTVQVPNAFIVGVGSDGVYWFKSHSITGKDAILDWQEHVQKRIDLVKKLAGNE